MSVHFKWWFGEGKSQPEWFLGSPKKAKVTLSANKDMTTKFWDMRVLIHVVYLKKGKTSHEEYYVNSTML